MNRDLEDYIKTVSNIIEIKKNNNNVCYTALFKGEYEIDIPGSIEKNNDWDYVIFTNIDNLETDWNVISVPLFKYNPIITNRIFKWLSNDFLKEYEICFYMDSFFTPIKNLDLNKLKTNSIIHKKHTKRNCVYLEVNACFKSKKINLKSKKKYIEFLQINNIPKNIGLSHNDIFIKNNLNEILKSYHKELINLMINIEFYRDQLFLPIIYFKNNYKINIDNNLNKFIKNNGKKSNHKYF